jgi:hypothetical protein
VSLFVASLEGKVDHLKRKRDFLLLSGVAAFRADIVVHRIHPGYKTLGGKILSGAACGM